MHTEVDMMIELLNYRAVLTRIKVITQPRGEWFRVPDESVQDARSLIHSLVTEALACK